MKKLYIWLTIFISIIIITFIVNPTQYLNASLEGLTVWAKIIVPSLLPFLFFTKILTETKVVNILSKKIKFTEKIFKTSPISSYIFLMSILTGYPVGAKITSDFYENKLISKQDAYKITTFCSTSGPMFLYASIGIAMLKSKFLGGIIFITHILGAFLNGILFRNLKIADENKSNTQSTITNEISLSECMWNSIQSVLLIGGYIVIFFTIISALENLKILQLISEFLKIFGIKKEISFSILSGIIEITHGTISISNLTSISNQTKTILCSMICAFGSFSTMFQSLIFLKKFNMNAKFFILIKICQTIITVTLTTLFLLIFKI